MTVAELIKRLSEYPLDTQVETMYREIHEPITGVSYNPNVTWDDPDEPDYPAVIIEW